jgi:hypothetical protein
MFLLLMLLIFFLETRRGHIYIIFMKKLYILIVFLTLWGKGAFGDVGKQEEIDFLLFLPNSSSQFADAAQATMHLDAAAHYLKSREILPGQIYVYGYAANAKNDIEPNSLSINRALFVIQELQKRGIASELFADPVGCGQVDLWGSNANESARSPNRRVRILLEDIVLTPSLAASESAVVIPPTVMPPEEPIRHEYLTEESRSSFPWWLLLLLLLALLALPAIATIMFFMSKRKRNASAKPIPICAQKAEPPEEKIKILEEEEIRRYAYELYDRRDGYNEDEVEDWLQSICELTDHYEALGYRVILYWEQEAP